MDEIDRANDLAEREREHALASRQRVSVQATDECQDCGLEISSARQVATGGTDMCAECAGLAEERAKRLRQ